MAKAHLYIRVSTDEQAERGFSQRDQAERLTAYCQRLQIEIGKVIFEDHSAKTFERPEWKNLLSSIKRSKGQECDFILFTKWDRFSRNTSDAYQMISTLRTYGIEVMAIDQPLDLTIPESKMMLAVFLSMPEVENDRRASNVFFGMRRGKKEGRWMGMALPGYKNLVTEGGRKYIAPIEPEASHMKWAFERISEGIYGTEVIWKMARRRGLKCSKSSFWSAITNPGYCGKVVVPAYKDEEMQIVEGKHEALISEELFYEVQEVMRGRKKKITLRQNFDEKLPLRGFLMCPKCDWMLTGSASKGRSAYYHYYHCKPECKVRYPHQLVNEEFENELRLLVPRTGVMEIYQEIILDIVAVEEHAKEAHIKRCLALITDQEKKVKKAKSLLLAEIIDISEYQEIKNECEANAATYRTSQTQHTRTTEERKEIEKTIKKALENLRDIIRLYEDSDVDHKRTIIATLFSNKWLFDGKKHRTGRMSEGAEFIYMRNKELQNKKTGDKVLKNSISGMVPSAGIEPARFPIGV
ncbi:recombinase family protein [Pedobacter xixiisoli]|uniref:recombinase family protein n=1 Tax=Pedobacter xixiisoli TaxID=1476464 RepID=UPI000BE2C839|nr:recombinase family protein [Pedobacter xixiisoli]